MDKKKALNKLMSLCSTKEKCIVEIKQKLINWQLDNIDIEEVIDFLKENNFINEERYTNAFVHDKFRFNKWGKIKIKYALKQKNISEHLINNALKTIDETDYFNTITEELNKKNKTIKDTKNIKSKLMRFAQSRGFEADLIFRYFDLTMK